jgi:hypothetical protein
MDAVSARGNRDISTIVDENSRAGARDGCTASGDEIR